ncbi:acyltransferase ChoActase/COT/CPT [Rickenella mellea]|uniref:Acyltransferase ChoActase/COT/CPT n=1 Tax=Rickenella mellea TaxID=50990 RepID=A0A4Y7QDL4_9AGAM|nr:acyltransferase ChoActase/COT/CPT [Rickenella mellea]
MRRQSDAAGTREKNAARTTQLKRLPVPPLRQTLDGYLKSLEPFLLEDAARGGPSFEESMRLRQIWADEFEHGLGKVCQERLLDLDRKSPHNWLDDNFWLKKAYLEWRAPLVVNSNWWCLFKNDENIPLDVREGQDSHSVDGITPWQVRRAVWIVQRILKLRDTLTTWLTRYCAGIWFYDSSLKFFNVCRVPQRHCDTLTSPPPPSRETPLPAPFRQISVLIHDWCYAVEIYDKDGKIISYAETERRIRDAVLDASRRIAGGEEAVPVGVLTSDHRDTWASNREHLLSLTPSNRDTMNSIESSILTLSLDHYTLGKNATQPGDALQLSDVDFHLHNIRSGVNARNRWFDKAITIVVESNGRAGMMGEHSPCDALVPSVYGEYAVVEDIDAEGEFFPDRVPTIDGSDALETHPQDGWRRLDWTVDDRLRRECVEAEARAQAIIADSDDSVLWFDDYGGQRIYQEYKFSPDAFIQLAIQLAWYRTRGSFAATYETALTRMFKHGRTETIRTFSTNSRAFVLAMTDSSATICDRYASLQNAISSHVTLTRNAMVGKAFDRHFLGLKLSMWDGESCALFDDELFHRSQEWKLSTSGLSEGHQFLGTGFGAAYPDGYGINYLAGRDMIKFGIESKYSGPLTSTDSFKNAISLSLTEMNLICDAHKSLGSRL